jgi:hypothetical protein
LVSSAVVRHESNYLLNPQHEDFQFIKIGGSLALETDERLAG